MKQKPACEEKRREKTRERERLYRKCWMSAACMLCSSMKLNIAVGCSKNKIFLYGNVFEMKKKLRITPTQNISALRLFMSLSVYDQLVYSAFYHIGLEMMISLGATAFMSFKKQQSFLAKFSFSLVGWMKGTNCVRLIISSFSIKFFYVQF